MEPPILTNLSCIVHLAIVIVYSYTISLPTTQFQLLVTSLTLNADILRIDILCYNIPCEVA